jgi:hypothetical protein
MNPEKFECIKMFYNSLYLTSKILLNYKEVEKEVHGPIFKILESDVKKKLIVCPRGAFKSSICVVSYAIWQLIRNPNLRILIDSELYSNSKTFVREIKEKIQTPMFIDLFGNWLGPIWTEGAFTVSVRDKIYKEPSIMAGGIGTVKTGLHFDLIIHDDLNSKKNSNTPEACQKIIDHYKYNLSILEPEGSVVVVGTRYSMKDLIGHIIEHEIQEDQSKIYESYTGQKGISSHDNS